MPDLVTVRAMRNFRLKHNIPLQEIAEAISKSQQWVSRIELGQASATVHNQYQMMLALQHIIFNRQRGLTQMEADFAVMKRNLLEEEPEWIRP